jgi:hypothetical protein
MTDTTMTDTTMTGYGVGAEFTALFLATGPDPAPGLPDALAGVDPALPLVELGAGTGLGTLRLADAVPDAEILAVEPDRAQRTALMTRLAGRPDLHARVTVVPADAFAADLPARWGGALAIHLLCQLSPPDRRRLLRLFAARLAPGTPAVVDWHYDATEPATVPERHSASVPLGRYTYERWFAARPDGPDASRVRNRYRVMHGDTVVAEQLVERTVPFVRGPELLADAAAAGLTATRSGAALLVLRPAAG